MDERTVRDIELDKVLDGVRRYALSPEGRDAIQPSLFTSDISEIEKRAALIDRYMSLSDGDAPDPFPPVRDLFDYASRTHADFPGENVYRVGLFLSSYVQMLHFTGEDEDIHQEDSDLSRDILSALDQDGSVRDDHPRLIPLQRELEKVRQERMRSASSFMHDNRDSIQQSEPMYRNERIVIPLRNDSKAVNSCYVSGSSSSGSTLFVEPFELVALNNEAVIARERIKAPLSIKIGYKYSSLASLLAAFDEVGLEGVVLFNRFFRPDIDIEKLEFTSGAPTSSADEYGEALRWIGLMSGELDMDFCGNTGIHSGESVVKMLLAGAKAVEVCSAVIKDGFSAIGRMNAYVEEWMARHGYSSLNDFVGMLAQENRKDGYNWERTQFLKTIS